MVSVRYRDTVFGHKLHQHKSQCSPILYPLRRTISNWESLLGLCLRDCILLRPGGHVTHPIKNCN